MSVSGSVTAQIEGLSLGPMPSLVGHRASIHQNAQSPNPALSFQALPAGLFNRRLRDALGRAGRGPSEGLGLGRTDALAGW